MCEGVMYEGMLCVRSVVCEGVLCMKVGYV